MKNKIREKVKNMNPKKGYVRWIICVVIFCVLAGVGTAVKFGSRIPEMKSQMEAIEKTKDENDKKQEIAEAENGDNQKGDTTGKESGKESGKEEKDSEHDHEFDIESILNLTTSDYVFLGIVAGLAGILFVIYWIYTTAYAVSKAWQVGANAYLFGFLTFFTNLFGVVCLWIYIRCHSICSKCGKLQVRKANNCSYCGTAIYIKCPNCDTRVSVKDAYCSGCGRKMND